MKIAVWHNLPSGGGKRALYYHVRGLVERGHTVEAWCPPTADQSYLPLKDLIPEHVVPLDWQPHRPRDPVRRAWANYGNMVAKLAAMDRHCRACAVEIERWGFDLLFANGDQEFLVSPIGRYVRIPSVLYLQEPYRPLYEAMPRLLWAALPAPDPRRFSPGYAVRFLHNLIKVQAARVQAREEQRSAAVYDRILVNSLFSRESIIRAYGLDAYVCYLGVDTNLFVPQPGPREPVILGLGTLAPAKDPAFIIHAVSQVAKPRPRLVWIANAAIPTYLAELEELARALQVTFEPKLRITDGDLVALLNRATVLAYAPRLEPFGFAPLEANACALPIVAVAEGGVRETVVDGMNGLLVAHDPAAMASALAHLLSDPAYARQLGGQGRAWVETRWSLSAAIDRLETHLYAVVAQRESG
ncbi:MAG TPA: glycosyltransferase family 4 protein [Chloroflexia bacterium]|jgi:glycosyltransferase involved in cell wall biosynthesis|nr:glycosyltransferase family 4 protein [Chloroflexia bacterium]